MQAETVSFLLDLNRQFYQTFGEAFAATRRRIQPGIQRALETIPLRGRWLDLGCGSGALAARWARDNRKGLYLGLDFSPVLLQEARAALPDPLPAGLDIQFLPADLSHPHWPRGLPAGSFDGVLAFAVLHHLPSRQLQARVLSQVRALLTPGQRFIFSVWQFQRSPKLMTRVQPWSTLPQLDPNDLEPGDTPADAVQLPNGKILIAWGRNIGDWRSGPKYRFAYTLLKPASLARAAPVRALFKPKSYEPDALAVGVTYDEQGNGIILWNSSGPPQRDIFYTRISRSSGAALTATMPIAAGIGNPNILINPREGLTTNLPPAP